MAHPNVDAVGPGPEPEEFAMPVFSRFTLEMRAATIRMPNSGWYEYYGTARTVKDVFAKPEICLAIGYKNENRHSHFLQAILRPVSAEPFVSVSFGCNSWAIDFGPLCGDALR
jgi:hypothetical protein